MASSEVMCSDCSTTALLANNQTAILNGHWWIAHTPASNQSFHTTMLSEDCRQIGLCALAWKQLMNFTVSLWLFWFCIEAASESPFFCSDLHSVFVVVMSHCWPKALQKSNNFLIYSDKTRRHTGLHSLLGVSLTLMKDAWMHLKWWKIHMHKFIALMFFTSCLHAPYNAIKLVLIYI